MKALRDRVGGIDEYEQRGFSFLLYESALKASTNKWGKREEDSRGRERSK